MKSSLIFLCILFSTFSMAQMPQKDLVFYFPFNGNMIDAGPNSIGGNIITTSTGGVALDADKNNKFNSCYYFDGGYMDFGLNESLTIGDSSFTFVSWVCATNSSSANTIYSNNFGFFWGMSIGQKNGTFYAAVCGGTMPNSISVNVVDDPSYRWYDWHHIAVVLNRSTHLFNMYVDGVKKNMVNETSFGPYGGTITGNDLDFTGLPLNLTTINTNTIGAYLTNGKVYQNFLGLIDEIALYRRALSESEIASIFSGTTKLHNHSSRRMYIDANQEILSIIGLEKDAYISIFNVSGETIASCMAKSIHIASLPKGLYFVKVNDGTKTFQEKFIRQ